MAFFKRSEAIPERLFSVATGPDWVIILPFALQHDFRLLSVISYTPFCSILLTLQSIGYDDVTEQSSESAKRTGK